MGERANVQSVEALRFMRLAMLKFGETCNSALGDAESDVQRTMNWLETEARTYWQGQLTKRHAIVGRCQEAVRMKRLYKDASGRPQSAVEEEKDLKIAQRMFAESQQKLEAIKRYTGLLRREAENFRTAIQRFATVVQQDVPNAAAKLDVYVMQIEQYASLAMPDTEYQPGSEDYQATGTGVDPSQAGVMKRSADESATPQADTAGAPEKSPLDASGPSTPEKTLTADQPSSHLPASVQIPPIPSQSASETSPAKDAEPGETHGRA